MVVIKVFSFMIMMRFLRHSKSFQSSIKSYRAFSQTAKMVIKFDENRIDFPQGKVEDAVLIHVDDDIIVVDKPANLLCAPGLIDKYNLASEIAQKFNIARVDHMLVHRLDYATSGVIIYARNEKALSELHRRFRERNRLFKRYTAVVHGALPNLEGEIQLPIGRDPVRGPPYFCINTEHGKDSETSWSVLSRSDCWTYVQLAPITGRTHQLRLHMAAIGNPILGDFFYAPDDIFNASNRLMLHAETLGIIHPVTKQEMVFTSPCPLKHLALKGKLASELKS